jgi:thiosulfate/3-mercaptopyruvate sulfurtransferase
MPTSPAPRLPGPLVSPAWLAAHLDAVRVVDGTYFLPAHKRDAAAEFTANHIPGAVRFDIDMISDRTNPLPHMVPTPEDFAAAVGGLGIGSDDTVVVYDGHGLLSAARVWWMFRLYGHDSVAVLDGGLPRWRVEGHPVESGDPTPTPATFRASFRPALLASAEDVATALADGSATVVDVRPADRFAGNAPEPRPGVRSGHMPGARNLPYNRLLAADQTVLPPAEILAQFAAIGHQPGAPLITSCGSGVTACIAALALASAGYPDTTIFDGSWSEWGGDPARPVVTGA